LSHNRKFQIGGLRNLFGRLLKNAVFRQPVYGTEMCRHFRWHQLIENEGGGKSAFSVPALKKTMDGLFQHPVRGDIPVEQNGVFHMEPVAVHPEVDFV